MKMKSIISTAVAMMVSGYAFAAPSQEDVQRSFYPYKESVPTFSGLAPGMVINQGNVAQFEGILDPVMFEHISNGWTEMPVTATSSFDLHPNYVKASADNLGNVSLGAEVGQISGWVAGRPFVEEPSQDDPRAGEKLAWNYKYGYNWGDNAAIYPFYWKYRDMDSGNIERTLKFNFHFLNFKGRVNQDPKPELIPGDEKYRAIYAQVLEPFDVKNTQLLIQRSIDDRKADNSYLYLGFQRRVRRLATEQVTDAFLGSQLMIEDFEGYNGRVSDMNWTYLGTQDVMLPFFNHDEVELDPDTHQDDEGYQVVAMGDKGGCYPQINWQLRKAYVLESSPVMEGHPISKRIHYIDAQTFTIPRTNIYDTAGKLWKTFIIGQANPERHLPVNKGSGVSIDDAVTMINVQQMKCTTAQFKGQVDKELNPESLFTVQNMRVKGR